MLAWQGGGVGLPLGLVRTIRYILFWNSANVWSFRLRSPLKIPTKMSLGQEGSVSNPEPSGVLVLVVRYALSAFRRHFILGACMRTLAETDFRGKLKPPCRKGSSKNSKIRAKVDSRIKCIWRLLLIRSCSLVQPWCPYPGRVLGQLFTHPSALN